MTPEVEPFALQVRQIFLNALPEETSQHGALRELRYTYVPASHAKALRPDSMLVVGMRGAGKSFWWSALQDKDHRALVAKVAAQAEISDKTQIVGGFGERPSFQDYPGKRNLSALAEDFEAHEIWTAVLFWQLARQPWLPAAPTLEAFRGTTSWSQRVEWIRQHPEPVEEVLAEADQTLQEAGHHWILLFDALDRTADDWSTMRRLIRGLLQVLLDLRPYRRLRAKVFLRTDQMDEAQVASFPDASKLLSGKVELEWPARELYNLLWQHLANEPEFGSSFRQECERRFRLDWESYRPEDDSDVYLPSPELRTQEELQRAVFHSITGPWMGRDRRRGYPYTWVPNHLGDADRRVSPRSFLAALRAAADDTVERDGHHSWPLHYESIKRGVQVASRIRVTEIVEDYKWVEFLMQPLEDTTVPCEFDEIKNRWEERGALEQIRKALKRGSKGPSEGQGEPVEQEKAHEKVRLPPVHLDEGPGGVRRDLEDLGIFERMRDGRVNVPDVFRVGYRLRRRGGVTPVAK